jgi:hypothetical protein
MRDSVDRRFVISPRFDSVGNFVEGLAVASLEPGRWGFINKGGTFAISPKFSKAAPFSDGFALVEDDEEEYPYFIDKRGRPVLKLKVWALWSFSDGLTVVDDNEHKRNYIDRDGKIIAPYEK